VKPRSRSLLRRCCIQSRCCGHGADQAPREGVDILRTLAQSSAWGGSTHGLLSSMNAVGGRQRAHRRASESRSCGALLSCAAPPARYALTASCNADAKPATRLPAGASHSAHSNVLMSRHCKHLLVIELFSFAYDNNQTSTAQAEIGTRSQCAGSTQLGVFVELTSTSPLGH